MADDIQLKDVNKYDYEWSISQVEDIISRNTYKKLSALTKLSQWKKFKEIWSHKKKFNVVKRERGKEL
ncbi:MAG: hypothetical protein CM15mV8_1660 [Caudoviricetes sp.]|nr:MAG: hypothetical protein CM15mV8_1660 [Caudoviricetes sp.]